MDTIWYYTVAGAAAYWRNANEEQLYTPNGRCDFFEKDGHWYRSHRGTAAYYLDDDRKWVYSMDGNPAFFRGD